MRRAVSVLEVAEPAAWAELGAVLALDALLEPGEGLARIARDDDALLSALQRVGLSPLVRYAHRSREQEEADRQELGDKVSRLRVEVRHVLVAAQRHAYDGVVRADTAWDPDIDGEAARILVGMGLLAPHVADGAVVPGRFRLHPDLPPPPPVPYDFAEAAMDETDDLSEAEAEPISLLGDLASLAAALQKRTTRRTHSGTLAKADGRALGRLLGDPELARTGSLEARPRWARALVALEAMGGVSLDPIARDLYVDLGLEALLAGSPEDALDRFVHKVVDKDLHVLVVPIRAALKDAGEGAVDELIFVELLEQQHRDVLFPAWLRDGTAVYPNPDGGPARPYDADGWQRIEARAVEVVLRRLQRLGVIRRAEGVFAGTPDGRRWAGASTAPDAPLWVTSDLEVVVPPDALAPWERFQLERMSRCLGRDTVDRHRLDRESLQHWLGTHEVDEAVALLRRHAPGVPLGVVETLQEWARAATRLVLRRGVLLEG